MTKQSSVAGYVIDEHWRRKASNLLCQVVIISVKTLLNALLNRLQFTQM